MYAASLGIAHVGFTIFRVGDVGRAEDVVFTIFGVVGGVKGVRGPDIAA